MLINYVQKGKLNLAEPYKMKPACEGGFFVSGYVQIILENS